MTGAGLAALALRYAAGTARADRSWPVQVESRLRNLGEVDEVSILPVVERLTRDGGELVGEPGLSYLVRAGGTRLLFDVGLSGGRDRSALVRNAGHLDVDLRDLDAVVISHRHADHVGGVGAMRRHTFAFAGEPLEPAGVPAYVPTDMHHDRARVVPTTGPRVVAPGVAVLPPLPRMLFWLGAVAEQALLVNVRGFGLVLISGCGHPPIERMLGVAELVLDVPIRAVVGGLHLPVHPVGTPLLPQAILGSPHPPWQPIGEADVAHVLDEITARGPRVVALSGHDSTPWTMNEFGRRLGDRYRTLRVGEELLISAARSRSAEGAG
ncbi:MBL fold metallo-hydrolase [Actinoplanes nipponensis]|uniref:MBL fold metallo-hydrolase n=1 Tax=Actinoplanes nipponensis TaxID=135950 RepID=UPI0019433296|nr:MBL fold metallo-hydrolase [Actinoplanes nipponensis]